MPEKLRCSEGGQPHVQSLGSVGGRGKRERADGGGMMLRIIGRVSIEVSFDPLVNCSSLVFHAAGMQTGWAEYYYYHDCSYIIIIVNCNMIINIIIARSATIILLLL